MTRICTSIIAAALALMSAAAVAQAPAANQPQQPASQDQQQAPAPAPQPTQTQAAPSQQTSLSAPSMQPAPLPQGCTAQDDKSRVRLRDSCGYVTADGKPVANASLELVESGQQNKYLFVFSRAITDAEGRFDFGPVPSGHYLLRTAAGAPVTVYNFVALDTQNADGKCQRPVEVKAAASGSCNSEVRSTGKGGFSLSGLLRRDKGQPKGDPSKADQKK